MKLLLRVLCIPASALFLTSCYVTPGGYDTGYAYDSGYYPGGGYYGGGGGYYNGRYNNHYHNAPNRPFGKPWSGYDDVRLGAGHQTSSGYRDPHNGGISHNHDGDGHRVDSRGHHVDAYGNHLGGGGGGGGGGANFSRPSGGRFSGITPQSRPAPSYSPAPSRPARTESSSNNNNNNSSSGNSTPYSGGGTSVKDRAGRR